MNKLNKHPVGLLVFIFFMAFPAMDSYADDTCMFSLTADRIPPNIVILLDNGAEMQHVVWHSDYDNQVDYTSTPAGLAVNGSDDDGDGTIDNAEEDDVVRNMGSGSGFFNDNDYGIVEHGGDYYLVAIQDDLQFAGYSTGIQADSSDSGAGTGIWTINGQTVTLPAEASAAVDVDGIKDNAGHFRYSKNYLNWIFFSGSYVPATDGALPHKSRFYRAKQAIMTVAKLASNKARFGIYNFVNDDGAFAVQPIRPVVRILAPLPQDNILDPNFINNINNMGTVTYSPLAEGLATIGAYFNSPSSHILPITCQKNFVIIVSPGVSSQDQDGKSNRLPQTLSDFDGDGSGGIDDGAIEINAVTYTIPTNLNGSTWLDDVAHYMYTNDMVGYRPGFQNVSTYTVGFMGDQESRLFLINTSNNGNGNQNLEDTDPPEYGKFHFTAESPDELAGTCLAALNTILAQNLTFSAPVVPVSKTMSSDKIYLAFFKPADENFWQGDIMKFMLNDQQEIIGTNGQPATWPNGALKEDALPVWSTKNWADTSAANGILHSDRNIYTYLGGSRDLADDATNEFNSNNTALTAAVLGNPTHTPAQIIDFLRGADVFDEDIDGNTSENRTVITGDVLHSQPLVFTYTYPNQSSLSMVFYGSNDGMLHAVLDSTDPDPDIIDDEVEYGTESWAFISPDQLHRLKDIVEGTEHPYFVDSSPQVYFRDVNNNGILEDSIDSDGDGDVDDDDKDRVIIVCGQRKGGTSYLALDVTDPDNPVFLWRISPVSSFGADVVIAELGESWSEPRFGRVKTSDADTEGIAVFFIGGGFSADNTAGQALLAIDVFTGAVVKKFVDDGFDNTEMDYSIASTVNLIDANNNGFVDKLYVGDLGGQMLRIGQFAVDSSGDPLVFPQSDENINTWTAHVLFRAPTYLVGSVTHARKFYFPPSVTLENGYDLVFMGTGDQEMACSSDTAADRIYGIKDTHSSVILTETDLVNVTDTSAAAPNLSIAGDVDGNGETDMGWYLELVNSSGAAIGEKVLAKGMVFYKTYYIATFTPSFDPCVPGGNATLFALNYKTGAAVMSFNGTGLDRSMVIGGGIPSTVVPIVGGGGNQTLLISLGCTVPDNSSNSTGAGILSIDPLIPARNFFYIWWREL